MVMIQLARWEAMNIEDVCPLSVVACNVSSALGGPATSHRNARDRGVAADRAVRNPSSAVAFLRLATDAGHQRVETASDLMSLTMTLDRYGEVLSGFASLHLTLDREISRQVGLAPSSVSTALDLPERQKAPSLSADLEALGRSMPSPVPFPLTSLAGALGALYVCEGATLGGRVIAPHIVGLLGADVPVSFFESYGSDVARMWADCRAVINGVLVSAELRDVAAASAIAVFARFAEVLS